MAKKTLRSLLLLIAPLILLAFYRGQKTPSKPIAAEAALSLAAPIQSQFQSSPIAPLQEKRERTKTPEPTKSPGALSASERELIIECLRTKNVLRGGAGPEEFSNLSEFVSRTLTHSQPEPTLLYRNLHITNATGQNLRLHIAPRPSSDGDSKLQARLFSTDDENLPIPMPLPDDLKDLDLDQIVENFKSRGQLTLDEVSESEKLSDQSSAHFLKTNGAVEKFEIYFENGALVCAKTTCYCM